MKKKEVLKHLLIKDIYLTQEKKYGEQSNMTIKFLPKLNGNVHFYKKVYILFILDISVDLT